MMIIDTKKKDLNPGTFFPFDENDPKAGGMTIRVMNNAAIEKMSKASQKRMVDYHSPGRGQPEQRFEYVEVDDDKEFELMWDYCIVNWTGLVDSEKKEIPLTKENKLRFMREHVEFIRFVTSCQRRIQEQFITQEETDRKNSSGPQEAT